MKKKLQTIAAKSIQGDYNNFNEMFRHFADLDQIKGLEVIEPNKDKEQYKKDNEERNKVFQLKENTYSNLFTLWLQQPTKGLEYGSNQFQSFLTNDFFNEFLFSLEEKERQSISKREKEAAHLKKARTPFTEREQKGKQVPKELKDIFNDLDFKKYISVLEKTTPPLLNEKWEFIGQPKKHKGVFCAWMRKLQIVNIIKADVNRSQLSKIFNNEIKNLNVGKDGKSFHNTSYEYDNNFKKQIENLLK